MTALLVLVAFVLGYLVRAWLVKDPPRVTSSVARSKCGTTTRRVLADPTRIVLADAGRRSLN